MTINVEISEICQKLEALFYKAPSKTMCIVPKVKQLGPGCEQLRESFLSNLSANLQYNEIIASSRFLVASAIGL